MQTDRELVVAARRGSRSALEAIFDRYWTLTWRAAYSVARQHDLADEAAQDAFLRARLALDRFDEDRSLAPWLARIAFNRAVDLLRVQSRDGSQLPELRGGDPDDGPTDHELHSAVDALDRDRRTVVVLHFFLGFTVDETAHILDIPTGTAASRLSRALGDLRRTLEAT